jgi:calcineurin-like phosphoesterase family protein
MPETYFIGDTHFGHKNIIEFEKYYRPFANIEEHNEELIKRWNSVVKPADKVYHLGDFCFGRKNIPIAGRLNGHKYLVMGNHDHYKAEEYLAYFEDLYGVWHYKKCVLSHVPIHPTHIPDRWWINIHGHLHSREVTKLHYGKTDMPDERYFNVSAERINLTPISWDEIYEQRKEYFAND